MKKILSAIIAASMLLAVPMSVSAAYTEADLSRMHLFRYEDTDGNVKYRAYVNAGYSNSPGYLYIMSDSETKPVVSELIDVSEIAHERDGNSKYYVYLSDHAMSKYGEDIYFSTELAEDMTGIDKIVEIETEVFSDYGYIENYFVSILPYDSIEAFEAEKDALIEKINAAVPQDGYGFRFGYVQSGGSGKVITYLHSNAVQKGADTEISQAFKNWETNPYPLYDLAETIRNETGIDASVYYILPMGSETPTIDSHVYYDNEIEYKVVYSAAPTNGDYNNDGLLEISDAQNLLSYSAAHAAGTVESLPIVSSAPENMDVDGDGEITIADAQYVLTYCAQQAAGMNPTWEEILK